MDELLRVLVCKSFQLQWWFTFAAYLGLAAKNFIDVGAGVVDSDYRGVLKVLLFNFSDTDFEVINDDMLQSCIRLYYLFVQVKKGDRIAQFICERIAHCQYEEVTSLDNTDRGDGGFGSTGV